MCVVLLHDHQVNRTDAGPFGLVTASAHPAPPPGGCGVGRAG